MWNDRTKLLIGKDGAKKLENSHVVVVGVGGVGGYAANLLVRAGVGKLTIVDFDKVDETNINRQIIANTKTIGRPKVDVAREMLLDINPKCNINTLSLKANQETFDQIFAEKPDYVIDAIDIVSDKIDLICYCKENDIKIVSAMGAGNRISVPNFAIIDIFKTSNDGLAKIVRKKLRERKIESLDVVTSLDKTMPVTQDADSKKRIVGSISYYPAMCGCVLSAFVIENLLK